MPIANYTLYAAKGALAASVTTDAATPTANATLIAFIAGNRNNADPGEPTITDSLGTLTWTKISSHLYSPSGNHVYMAAYYTIVGGSPSSMTVTGASASAATGTSIGIFQCTGPSTDFSNYAFADSSTGDPSITITQPASTSLVVTYAEGRNTNAFTHPTNSTEILDAQCGTAAAEHAMAYEETTPGTTWTWSSSNANSVGMAIELKLAAFSATSACTTKAVTSSATAAIPYTATSACTGKAATSSATATQVFAATSACSAKAATTVASASLAFAAASACTTAALTTEGAAALVFSATSACATAAAISAAAAEIPISSYDATSACVTAAATTAAQAIAGAIAVLPTRRRHRGGGVGGRAKPSFELLGYEEMRLLDWMPHAGPVPDELKPGRQFQLRLPRRRLPDLADLGPLPQPPTDFTPLISAPPADLAGQLERERRQQEAALAAATQRRIEAEAIAAQQAQQRLTDLEAARRRRRQRDEEALMWLLAA